MKRSDDTGPRANAAYIPPTGGQPAPRSYAASRSAATRPLLSMAALNAGRHTRAVQLSWMGLVRR